MFESEGEVAAVFGDGTAELEAVALFADGGAAGGEGIFGVHEAGGLGGEERAVILGLAGPGIYLDAAAAVGRTGVFGGEEIGVDTDEGDGGFGRNLSAVLKAVDGDDRRAGSSASSCSEDLDLAAEFVGIVGKLCDVGGLKSAGAGDVLARDAGIVGGGIDFGIDGEDLEADGERVRAGTDFEAAGQGLEAVGVDGNGVRAVGKTGGGEAAVAGGVERDQAGTARVGAVSSHVAGSACDGDGGVLDEGAACIDDLAGADAGVLAAGGLRGGDGQR